MNKRANSGYRATDNQLAAVEIAKSLFSDMYDFIDENCQPNRETSLAFTKLEEAHFWLAQSIMKNGIQTTSNKGEMKQ